MSGLTHKVAVYVPSKIGGTFHLAKLFEYTKYAHEELAKAFGGATSMDAQGSWVGADGELIFEDVNIVWSNVSDEDFEGAKRLIRDIAETICEDMRQEAVSYEIDNVMYFAEV